MKVGPSASIAPQRTITDLVSFADSPNIGGRDGYVCSRPPCLARRLVLEKSDPAPAPTGARGLHPYGISRNPCGLPVRRPLRCRAPIFAVGGQTHRSTVTRTSLERPPDGSARN